MPIVFIHGVGVRDEAGFHEISPLLRRYIAPVISDDPATVAITSVFWGPKGVSFAWDGASRPRTRLLAAGAEEVAVGDLEALMATATLPGAFAAQPVAPATGAPSPFTAGQASVGTEPPRRLRELSPEALSDLLALLAAEPIPDPEARANAAIRADAVARDPALVARLAAAPDLEAEIDLALAALGAEEDQGEFLAQGGPGGRWSRLRDRLRETLSRGASLPAYAVSTAAAEIRPGLNNFVSYFLGDVFIYLRDRGTSAAPGPIPKLFLDAFREAAANKAARGGGTAGGRQPQHGRADRL
jgi:hypothetical protein